MNYLMCSAGRRCELLRYFQNSAEDGSHVVVTDNSIYAPALYVVEKHYIVPKITVPGYIEKLLEICQKEKINGIATLIDPEIEILAQHREKFKQNGVEVFVPDFKTAHICFDKYMMYQYLKAVGIPTVETWNTIDAYLASNKPFPVFVKPRLGSGSVGAMRINTLEQLENAFDRDPSLIIQELMVGLDLDADVYVDTITHQAVSAFLKRKLETKIGGASKTVSFKDPALFSMIQDVVSQFRFSGPINMDFFYQNGMYYLSEINPRFGGGYIHTYRAGIDFIKMMEKNLHGQCNTPVFGNYDEGS